MIHIAPLPHRCGLFLGALMSVIAVGPLNTNESNERHPDMVPVAYFMDQSPPDVDAPDNLPKHAQNVTVAKVRFADGQGPVWLGGRHCEGCTNDILGAQLKIVELYAGRAAHNGEQVFVRFGLRSEHRQFMAIPLGDQTSRNYIVVIYKGGDGMLRLVPFRVGNGSWTAINYLLGTRGR